MGGFLGRFVVSFQRTNSQKNLIDLAKFVRKLVTLIPCLFHRHEGHGGFFIIVQVGHLVVLEGEAIDRRLSRVAVTRFSRVGALVRVEIKLLLTVAEKKGFQTYFSERDYVFLKRRSFLMRLFTSLSSGICCSYKTFSQ